MKSPLNRYARWGIAIIAISLLVWYVGPAVLLSTLRGMELGYVLAYFAAFLAVPFLYGAQMWGSLWFGGYRLRFGPSVAAAVNSWSVGTITPARAGDLTLSYFLGASVRSGDAHALVVVDKAVSLVVLAGIATFGASVLPPSVGRAVMIGASFVLAVALVGLATIALPGADRPLRALVRRVLGDARDAQWTEIRAFVQQPSVLAWCLAMAALRWAYIGLINLLIFRAAHYAPDLATVLVATSVGRIISIVPVSIGGMGVKEPVQILIYGAAGVNAEAVIAVSIVGMACGFAVAAAAPLVARLLGLPAAEQERRT